eukprot:GHVT01030593.1.p1 GENE.GHVT01030593.1~~GHVT01030593.1.p1  ORF type:complete len:104 (+),score=9.61 GHVT01030593.1:123-434(+)
MKLGKAMILLAFAAGIVILTWKTQASEAPGWDHDDINLSWINSDDETDYSLNGVDDLMAHSIPEGSEVPPLHQIKTKQELEELEGQIAQQSAGGAAVPQNGKL